MRSWITLFVFCLLSRLFDSVGKLTGLIAPAELPLPSLNASRTSPTMSSGGEVQCIDMRQCETPELLAEALEEAMQTSGFLFILGHGLEKQAEDMFAISGE